MSSINAIYFKQYRNRLGFRNQNDAKLFFGAKDIVPVLDYKYIRLLNRRLFEIIAKIDGLVHQSIKVDSLEVFCHSNIIGVYDKLKKNNILEKLNNQGRRPEEVYFSWMRGFVVSSYFVKSISQIFEVNPENIELIGDDDLINIETFKRSPKADLQIKLKNGTFIRVEVQSGFQGINDIKQHKVLEAKRIKREENITSLVIHFDIFNGQVAFVKIDEIDDNNINWITRQQMEGQTVFNIDQNSFLWRLIDAPPHLSKLSII